MLLLLRRVVSTSILAAFVATTAGCGHQVTPDRDILALGGKMLINFQVKGQLDFVNFNYVIVFNTCGTGGEPYPNAYATTFTNYSYAFAIGANYSTLQPSLFEYYIASGAIHQLNVTLGASTTELTTDLTGDGTTFQLIFTRAQLDNPLAVAEPCPSSGATPAPANAPTWYINFFTVDTSGHVLDSLGVGGAQDTTYVFTIDTTTASQNTIQRPAGSVLPSNMNAAINGGQINNYP